MNIKQLKSMFDKAENELVSDGWEKILSVMSDAGGLKYGSLYTKDGVRFYLNKDTLMQGLAGPQMANACYSLFN